MEYNGEVPQQAGHLPPALMDERKGVERRGFGESKQ
jgi:hypothetical protein